MPRQQRGLSVLETMPIVYARVRRHGVGSAPWRMQVSLVGSAFSNELRTLSRQTALVDRREPTTRGELLSQG